MPRATQPKKTLKYSKQFKVAAVKLSLKYGMRVKDVAHGLGIHPFMLSRWRKEYREGTLVIAGRKSVNVGKKETKQEKELSELARMKRKIKRLEEENDLLKKWQRYLAEQRKNDLDSSNDTER